ncbi:Dabb family protein [Flammeovirgaceae bacterium SG7u.111]|nr:Dabb family protein [Flammeovirgaceae bacterium SG7u.132]WPO35890.1 Dabb family protein [Flammeovirgaceae bacterium SG7u.111]
MENSESNLFVHHVFFWLKKPNDEAVRQQFEKGLEELVKIKEIKSSHLGVPADTDRPVIDSTYQYSLLVLFDSKANHDIYQDHPIHHKFIAENSMYWEKVQVYDSVDM